MSRVARPDKKIDEIEASRVREAIEKQRGVITKVAQTVGCSRSTMRRWLDKHPYYKEMAKAEREGVLDLLESTAWKLALGKEDPNDEDKWQIKPDPKMLQFLLKTIGQDRGYYEGPQFGQGNPNQVINITIGGSLADADKSIEVEHEVMPELPEAKPEAKPAADAEGDA